MENLHKLIKLYESRTDHVLLTEVENVCLTELAGSPLYPVLHDVVIKRRNYWTNKSRKASTTSRSKAQFTAALDSLKRSIDFLSSPPFPVFFEHYEQ